MPVLLLTANCLLLLRGMFGVTTTRLPMDLLVCDRPVCLTLGFLFVRWP